MKLTAVVNGQVYDQLPAVKNEITFIKDGSSTLLSVPFYTKEATQYDTLNIPFMVYDPDLESCDVSFYVNDIKKGGDRFGRGLQYWPYTLTEYGNVTLTIRTDNGEASKSLELVVNEIQLDSEEVQGAAVSLKAINFSTNNELKNHELLEFSDNFDWENGGIRTEKKADGSIEKFICVRQGTQMTVKYAPFGKFSNLGKDIKICFKATNCYDYSASVLNCYDESSGRGLRLDAQQAIFSSDTFPNFATQYYENSYIELETEIWPDVADKDTANNLYGDRFIMFWVDGIPAGVKAFPQGESFVQRTPQNITIGSDSCDVYIYVIKVYERKLTEDEHLDNFIMDAPSTQEMLNRYHRNNILDNSGEISYTKLVEQNPDCHVYMYDMARMTTSKSDKVDDCTYTELFGLNNSLENPYYSAEGVQVYVQGTSSAAYGAAAFNLRSKFKKGLIDKDGNEVDGWKVTEDAIPIELPCTKVNVASCENVNNVVNQEWYNRYQPYHDAHRRKQGKKYRDTMQFESGVVFVKDNNPKGTYLGTGKIEDKTSSYLAANCFLDTSRKGIPYYQDPYYKMYAIGNMGNDKKNVEVFHDTENPKACCIEVLDNQNAAHWMTVPTDLSTFDLEDPYYEFRYPEEGASVEMKQAWVDFVNWMAASNPKDATGEPLVDETGNPITVEYKTYEFKGFDPPGYEGTPNPSGVSLKGFKVSAYNGEYTHDTYEYRMAKMLHECEDHIVMDSIVYHYLFIQRHTMVDNVAKNTFWSTEDLVHWDLTKDYDNDTSDGNNNSGYLVFTYGIENLDKDSAGADIFNASDSVWIQFIHGLPTVQEFLHKKLANYMINNAGAWDSEAYLAECRRHQNRIPERCWISDYFRKYIRPRRLGLDENTFLNRLEGGKKTHQRAQYENYQEFYLNSKYLAGTPFTEAASIDMRLNKKPTANYVQCTEESEFSLKENYYIKDAEGNYILVQDLEETEFNSNKTLYYILGGNWDENNILTVSCYSDCYPSILIGGQYHRSPERIKRGNSYDLPVGTMIQSASDSTCYLLGAAMIQTLSGLAKTYPSYVKLANAGKLRRIEYGSNETGYYNPNLVSLDVGSNKMLQYVQAQNSGTAAGIGAADLSGAAQLQDVLVEGSTLTTLTLPQGGIIRTIHLNALTQLTMQDLTLLEDISLDEDIFTSMNNLTIKNCPAMDPYSYRMALEGRMTDYELTDFNWTVSKLEDLNIVDGKVNGIKVVDRLFAESNPKSGEHATSLVGTINIAVNAVIDEYELYEKYCKDFPNLIITYDKDIVTDLNPAVEILFMGNNSENASIHYRVLGSGEDSIGELISADGPTGVAIKAPNKESTIQTSYKFSGYWSTKINPGIDDILYYVDGLENPEAKAENFNGIFPTENMIFYPVFESLTRAYTLKFYDYNNKLIESKEVPYNMTYKDTDGELTNFYYLSSDKLPNNQRYGFKCWTTVKYEAGKGKDVTPIDIFTYKILGPMTLYPYYEIEDVYEVPSNIEYFEKNGIAINVKTEYLSSLQGKITIPNIDGVNKVGKICDKTSKITEIYFLRDNSYTEVA